MKPLPFLELFIIIMLRLFSWSSAQCTVGQYFKGLNECSGCPPDTYMDQREHKEKKCFDCTVNEDPNSEVKHPCNSTHDTVFRCADGYFNSDGRHLVVCHQCRSCEYVARECSSVEDTTCCPREGMMLQELMDNSDCEAKSIGNTKYCCIKKAPSYSTTSSSKHTTGLGSVSFSTTEKDSSSYIPKNLSDGLDSSKNVSRSDTESMSAGTLAAIIAGSILSVIVIPLIIVIVYIRSKRRYEMLKKHNVETIVNPKNDHELQPLGLPV